jgi:hypothetical protein
VAQLAISSASADPVERPTRGRDHPSRLGQAERDAALILLDGRPPMTIAAIVIVDPRRMPDEGRHITVVMNCSAEGEEMLGDVMK